MSENENRHPIIGGLDWMPVGYNIIDRRPGNVDYSKIFDSIVEEFKERERLKKAKEEKDE